MNYKHGLAHTRIDNIYKAMISRCYNPKNNRFCNYGLKGITVCDEWLHDKNSFFEWAFANGYNANKSIDRIDVFKGYSPENCKWSTMLEQANNKSNNRYILAGNEKHTIGEWSRITGISISTIWARLNRGWSEEDAIRKPLCTL